MKNYALATLEKQLKIAEKFAKQWPKDKDFADKVKDLRDAIKILKAHDA